jgi:Mn-dependent DtxR family transcriptional regulator
VSDHALILGERIKRYTNKTIRQCLIDYLEHESILQNSRVIKLDSKTVLAEKIGVQRTSLSGELAKMKKNGLVRYDNKTIEIF